MESLSESLLAIQDRLTRSHVDSVVIGALAVAVWGEPRVTRDVDLKVMLTRGDARRLADILGTDFDCLGVNPVTTLEQFGMLFVRDKSGTRIDLLLMETGFDEGVIRRGVMVELLPGVSVKVCSAEDLIVYKLLSSRPRDGADAESIVIRQGQALDTTYIISNLREFEHALDDSTLVSSFKRMLRA